MIGFIKTTIVRARYSKRISQLIVLISFLISFIVIRIITNLQRLKLIPNQDEVFHIHHLVPGIILTLISGYVAISFWDHRRTRIFMTVLFGIGAALTIDEFALWLFLKDVYWAQQGRESVDAIIFVITLLTILFVISEIHDHYHVKKILRKIFKRKL